MKVLLDEDVPVRLRFYFQTAEVETVEYRGWKGLKNGALLRAAQEHFDVLVTMDNNLPEQQPLRQFNIAVAILRTPSKTLEDLAALVPKLEQLIAGIQPAPQYACTLRVHS